MDFFASTITTTVLQLLLATITAACLWQVKVMRQQLVLFHDAIAAFFSGNQAALDGTIQQFSVPRRPSVDMQH